MRYSFNPFERAVGFFLLTTIFGTVLFGMTLAVKKNWLEEKNYYFTKVESASNIREGSSVFLSGLKIGKIEEIILDSRGELKVKFSVLKKYSHSLVDGTFVQFTRPFILGERVLNIVRTKNSGKRLPANSLISTLKSHDILEALSGQKVNQIIDRFDSMSQNLDDLIRISKNVAEQIHEKDKVRLILNQLANASRELKNIPHMAKNAGNILTNLNDLSTELNELRPYLRSVAQKMPEGSEKSLHLLDESLIIVKALQKNMFLKDHVKAVKIENDKNDRLPAQEKIGD
jgi:ABC-type transporter Mla subunit MlaD